MKVCDSSGHTASLYVSMVYMEITALAAHSLKLKGKHAALFVNPLDKTSSYNAAIILGNSPKSSLKIRDDVVTISGPGEYEAAGITMTGTRADTDTIYSITLDDIEILLGTRSGLEKLHQRLQEHAILIVDADSTGDISFVSSLGMNSILFFGEHGAELADSLSHENKKEMTKYAVTRDKLPAETETILLVA